MSHARDVSRYYDLIYFWTQWGSRFRAFAKPDAHTIHRGLTHPTTGIFSSTTIHDLIAEAVRNGAPIDALDAGCGYGGTALDLHKRLSGRFPARFHGITINATQIRVAQRSARVLGLAEAVTFDLASYDAPLSRTFNLIYGIESLVHSADPQRTIANLASALRAGGMFVIIDDMPIEDVPASYARDLDMFKAGWRCPILPTAQAWRGYLRDQGLVIEAERDLTPLMRPKAEPELLEALRYSESQRRKRAWLGMSMVTDAQIGGLMLERLTRERIVEHRMIIARRPQ